MERYGYRLHFNAILWCVSEDPNMAPVKRRAYEVCTKHKYFVLCKYEVFHVLQLKHVENYCERVK